MKNIKQAICVIAKGEHLATVDHLGIQSRDALKMLELAKKLGNMIVFGVTSNTPDACACGAVVNDQTALTMAIKLVHNRISEEGVDESHWYIAADEITRKRAARYLRKLEA